VNFKHFTPARLSGVVCGAYHRKQHPIITPARNV
jgi:hypothetical protein